MLAGEAIQVLMTGLAAADATVIAIEISIFGIAAQRGGL